MNPSLILFDLDGTLVDTAPEIAGALNALLNQQGWPSIEQERVMTWVGHGSRDLLAQALAHLARQGVRDAGRADAVDALMPAFGEHYLAHSGVASNVYAHVDAVLDLLREQGKHLVVLSNKDEQLVLAVLERHGLRDYFELVIGGDTLPTKKPDPSAILHCMRLFGAAAERTLMVGDSAVDVATARAAGVAAWVVDWGYNGGRPIEGAGADRIVRRFDELFELAEAEEPGMRVSTY